MRHLLAATLGLACISCATIPDSPDLQEGDGACDVSSLAPLVGQAPTAELGAEALRLSGARRLRWIRPDDAVTMDYRTDRLNVRLDAAHRVEAFNCG